MKAFISYSHKDGAALERLHTHLAMLLREGKIIEWFDRDILAGDHIESQIVQQLETSDLFLFLVSPDFLASSYCYDTEMKRALERHRAGQARVVPIIVEPCDWKSSPLRELKAVPKDGHPFSEWTNENTAFLDIVQELRRIVDAAKQAFEPSELHTAASKQPLEQESRRYRVKRDFDDIDRDDFRDAAFNIIQEYFRSAIAEIDGIEGIKGRFKKRSNQSFGCMVVNQSRSRGTAHLTVYNGSGGYFSDIYYSFSEDAPENSASGGFGVEADEYELFLKRTMSFSHDDEEHLTPERAAEALWSEFIQQAGISYD